MPKGTIKFFTESKGFGFITNNETQKDIFVHVSGLIDQVREGDIVTYDEVEGKKGMNATNVKVQ